MPIAIFVALLSAKTLVERADALLNDWARAKRFTGAALIAVDGKPILRKAYGYADWSTRRTMTPETPMAIFSISKSFTAGALLLLQEKGLLKVEDPIAHYVEDLPEAWKQVTIHQLMTHTSGVKIQTRRNL